MKIVIILMFFNQLIYSDNYYYQNLKKVKLIPHYSTLRISSNIDYYKNCKGIILGVTNKLIVKLKNASVLNRYLHDFNLTKEKTLSKNLFLLKTQNKNLTISISNRLNEKSDVKYAHPDFIKKVTNR